MPSSDATPSCKQVRGEHDSPEEIGSDARLPIVWQELLARPELSSLLFDLIEEALPRIKRRGSTHQAEQEEMYEVDLLLERISFERRCRDAGVPCRSFLDKPEEELRSILKEARRLQEEKLSTARLASKRVH